MRIVIPTSNEYVHLCQTCLDMLNVHWRVKRPDDEIVFLVYDNIPEIRDHYAEDLKLNSVVKVISLGNQKDYGDSWTKGIMKYLTNNPCSYFMLMLEDHIIHGMRSELVEKAEAALVNDTEVSKVELMSDAVKFGYQVKDDDFFIKNQDARYRTSVMPAIWRTEYFLDYAGQCATAWDFEIKGGDLAKNDGAKILSLRENAVDVQNFLKRGKLLERKLFERPRLMSIVCVTRGRPERFGMLLESIKKNTQGIWELIALVDSDDDKLGEYDFSDERIAVITCKPGCGLYRMTNMGAFASRGDLIQFAADDCVFETWGWDEMIRKHMPSDGVFTTECFDGKMVTSFHQCISRKSLDVIGYMFPTILKSYYGDPWIEDIFAILRRVLRLPEMIIRHNHDHLSDKTRDAMEVNKLHDKLLYRAHSYERMQAAYKLKGIMHEF